MRDYPRMEMADFGRYYLNTIVICAGILAVQMLALSDEALAGRLREYKESMAREVEEKDAALQNARK